VGRLVCYHRSGFLTHEGLGVEILYISHKEDMNGPQLLCDFKNAPRSKNVSQLITRWSADLAFEYIYYSASSDKVGAGLLFSVEEKALHYP
jgi:hypothetical protein